MTRPETDGIEPSPAMIECLRAIIWCQKNDISEADVFWEDLAIMVSGVDDERDLS